MYPTIIFGLALLSSMLTIRAFIDEVINCHLQDTRYHTSYFLIAATVIFWCWFYYLTH